MSLFLPEWMWRDTQVALCSGNCRTVTIRVENILLRSPLLSRVSADPFTKRPKKISTITQCIKNIIHLHFPLHISLPKGKGEYFLTVKEEEVTRESSNVYLTNNIYAHYFLSLSPSMTQIKCTIRHLTTRSSREILHVSSCTLIYLFSLIPPWHAS